MTLLEARYKASNPKLTQADLARRMRISPRTFRRWKGLKKRPSTAFGDRGNRITQTERYIFRQRPKRVAPKPSVAEFRIADVQREDAIVPGDLIGGQFVDGFSFVLEDFPKVLEQVQKGRTLVYQIGISEGLGLSQQETFIVDPGLSPGAHQSAYYWSLRNALKLAGGGGDAFKKKPDYEAKTVILTAVTVAQ